MAPKGRRPRNPSNNSASSGSTRAHSEERKVKKLKTRGRSQSKSNGNKNFLQQSNMFEPLSNDVPAPDSAHQATNPLNSAKTGPQNDTHDTDKKHIPPIVIFNVEKVTDVINHIHTAVHDIDKSKLRIKLTQFGTKVFLDTTEHFKVVRNYLREKNINFYTHTLPEEKTIKFVVYGVPSDTTKDEILGSLAEYNLYATDAKPLNIKKPRYNNHANFIIYFKESDHITLNQLNTVRGIRNCSVTFRRFSKNELGPTQCTKCLSYGHGKSNCNLFDRCVRCGARHASDSCPHRIEKENPKSKIPADLISCANCKGPHTANYKGCPSRQAFIDLQNSIRKPTRTTRHTRQVSFSSHALHYGDSFPQLHTTKSAPYSIPGQSLKFSDVVKRNESGSDNLFSKGECLQIFDFFLAKLQTCKTKVQQARAIAQFVFEFLGDDDSK